MFSYPLPLPPPPPPIVSLSLPLNSARHNSIPIPIPLPRPNYDYDYDYDDDSNSDSNDAVPSQVYYHSSTRASLPRKRGRRLNKKVPSRRKLSFSSSSYPSLFSLLPFSFSSSIFSHFILFIDILPFPSLLPSSIFCFPQHPIYVPPRRSTYLVEDSPRSSPFVLCFFFSFSSLSFESLRV